MSAVNNTPYRLDVGLPGPSGLLVGMTDIVPEENLFITYSTLCHDYLLYDHRIYLVS